jgi:signal transduction histidine kinase
MRDAAPAMPERLGEQGVVGALRASVEQDLQDEFDRVTWRIAEDAEAVARRLPSVVGEVVYFAVQELIRNAARHGRGGNGDRPLQLQVGLTAKEGLCFTVEDDGVGYAPGSEPVSGEATGSRQGLRFHSTMLTALGARMEVTALPEGGTRGTIWIPPETIRGAVE